MILRSVIKHLRKQEWTAIALDFLIVVVGVFIGIQVSNWNATRLEHQKEIVFLSNMRDDLRDDAIALEARIMTLEQAEDYGEDVLLGLNRNEPCMDDCWRFIVHAFHASQWFDLSVDRSTFDEMRRAGMPQDDELKDALTRYFIISERLDLANEIPRYRELARSIIPVAAQHQLWKDCYGLEGEDELMVDDCPPALTPNESRAVVETLWSHPDTKRYLTYRVSTIALLVKALRSLIAEGETVIDMIDQAIGN